MERARVLLFDLGGVLVHVETYDSLRSMLGQELDDQAIRDRWLGSVAARSFETGRISPESFARRLCEEWRLEVSPAFVLEELSSWIRLPYEGAADLIAHLRGSYHVSCLSNSNQLHWTKLAPFVKGFDSVFSSHLTGKIKPDREAFEDVLSRLRVLPEEVRFFDDSRANVESAGRLGIPAFLVHGIGDLRQVLSQQELLQADERSSDGDSPDTAVATGGVTSDGAGAIDPDRKEHQP